MHSNPGGENTTTPHELSEAKLKNYKESLNKQAEELITSGFLKTIAELNDLLESPKFRNEPMKNTNTYNSNILNYLPKEDLENLDSIITNKVVTDLVEIVKPFIRKLIEDSNVLKMWISFMIPKIEDGNNFGVAIQEDALMRLSWAEGDSYAFYDQISKYYNTRGKCVTKVTKYPCVDDYKRAIAELDDYEYLQMWVVVSKLRNHYCTLHDTFIKNLERIKIPRTTNVHEILY